MERLGTCAVPKNISWYTSLFVIHLNMDFVVRQCGADTAVVEMFGKVGLCQQSNLENIGGQALLDRRNMQDSI
jgi:hypothetical protein